MINVNGGASMGTVREIARGSLRDALAVPEFKDVGISNMRFLAGLIRLPDALEDWPEDSRRVREMNGGEPLNPNIAYFRCRFLDAEGKCCCYERRPRVCRNFTPNEKECSKCASFGTTCFPPNHAAHKDVKAAI